MNPLQSLDMLSTNTIGRDSRQSIYGTLGDVYCDGRPLRALLVARPSPNQYVPNLIGVPTCLGLPWPFKIIDLMSWAPTFNYLRSALPTSTSAPIATNCYCSPNFNTYDDHLMLYLICIINLT